MASAAQIKALLKSHVEGDDDRFFSVAMQVAAHEAKLGHGKLALELRDLVDDAKRRRGLRARDTEATPIARPKGDLAGLLEVSYPKERLSHLVVDPILDEQLRRVLREQRHASSLLSHGLQLRRKLLLVGPPGTGKTMTASALAGELGLPLCQVRLDALITRYMGETAAKLRQVFDSTDRTRGIYFFDEFDAIGAQRGLGNDVGEIRRVLNSFLQMIEQDRSHSLILAATNHPELLDHALFRRFDDVLRYELPNADRIAALMKGRLQLMTPGRFAWKQLANHAKGLSCAEVVRACEEAMKSALMSDQDRLDAAEVERALDERHTFGTRLPLGRS